jgi:multiple sugar transport system permease protein
MRQVRSLPASEGTATKHSLSTRTSRVARRVLLYVSLILLSGLFLIPLYWMVTTSFKEQGQVFQVPPQWIPNPWVYQNYAEATRRAPLWLWLQNTATITLFATVGNVIASSMVGYGFARIKFPGRDFLFIVLLSTMMLPSVVTLIPRFILFREIGWNDTFYPLTVPNWFGGGAFNIFLVRQYYLTLPRDLDEAAKIDGCSNWGVWWRILTPLAYPVLVAVGLFAFVGHWQDFMDPLIFLSSERMKTLSLGLRAFVNPGDASWHIAMASSMWLTGPMIVVFFVGQRYFIKGIAMSGITGR